MSTQVRRCERCGALELEAPLACEDGRNHLWQEWTVVRAQDFAAVVYEAGVVTKYPPPRMIFTPTLGFAVDAAAMNLRERLFVFTHSQLKAFLQEVLEEVVAADRAERDASADSDRGLS